MPKPNWWYTLQESRRQAMVAIDFYNRAGDKRSYLDFVVHMHLAWQNLLHADRLRRKQPIQFREKNGRYKKDKDGNRLTWDLATCVKHEFSAKSPVRANVEFFIGLRNCIEHRYQEALLVATASHSHALVINYEAELVTRFGVSESLADELRFPVFVQSLTPKGLDEQRKLRKGVPAQAKAFITQFESDLSSEVREDTRFEYRVLLTPIKGPKTEADMAITFVNTKDMTKKELADLQAATGTVLVAEKQRSVGLVDELLPRAATRAIAEAIPFHFSDRHFLNARRNLGVGPQQHQKGDASDGVNCIYVAPTRQYVYTKAFVNRCIKELSSADRFEALTGKSPTPKSA